MTTKKIIAFVLFYITVIAAILLMHFYIQDRYGNPRRIKSESQNSIITAVKLVPNYVRTGWLSCSPSMARRLCSPA